VRRKPNSLLEIERAILDAGLMLKREHIAEFHGYQLAKTMQEAAHAKRLIGHGTLYKALDRLERAGLLSSRWEDPLEAASASRPRRRLYQVTAAGRSALASTQVAPLEVKRALRREATT
jgi:PadR family transcriptional regulator, regulatory protein PadR